MALQTITIPEEDLGLGIDTRSPETSIPPGHVSEATNVDAVGTRLVKRRGFQGRSGFLPTRVRSLTYTHGTTTLVATLDPTIDLGSLRSTPVVVAGRSAASGFADTYYPGFSANIRSNLQSVAHPSDTPASLGFSSTAHGFSTSDFAVRLVQSTSEIDLSWSSLLPEQIKINDTTLDVTIDYLIRPGGPTRGIAFFSSRAPVAGSVFVSSSFSVPPGTTVQTITVGTHGLDTTDILVEVWDEVSGERQEITPDSVTINTAGDVAITLTNSGTATLTGIFATLSSRPASSVWAPSVSIAPGTTWTGSTTLPADESPLRVLQVWVSDGVGGKILAFPDSVSVDVESGLLSVSITNGGATGIAPYIIHEEGIRSISELTLVGPIAGASGDFSDSSPEVSVWGLDHAEIYSPGSGTRAGWVSHLDTYHEQLEGRVVAGLGGVLHAESTTAPLLPAPLHVRARDRVSGSVVLSPTFHETGSLPGRTGGYITGTSLTDHEATATQVTYHAGTGETRFVLTIPALAAWTAAGAASTVATVIPTGTTWMTVSGTSWARHSGTFRVESVSVSGNNLTLGALIPGVDSSDWDDYEIAARVGIFTGSLPLQAASHEFVAGDRLLSDSIPDSLILELLPGGVSNSVVVGGIVETLALGAGTRVVGSRESAVLPLRLEDGTPSVERVVRGDEISHPSIPTRRLRVEKILPLSSRVVNSWTTSGFGTSVVTLATPDTIYLAVGGRVLLTADCGALSGTRVISGITDTFTFTVSSPDLTDADSGSGRMVGYTVEVDETLTLEDDTSSATPLAVTRRFVPVDVPHVDDATYGSYEIPLPLTFQGSATDEQDLLRSTQASSSLFLVGSDEPVWKYDGANIYHAGLPRWQAETHATVDWSGAGIDTSDTLVGESTSAPHWAGAVVTLSSADAAARFVVGDRVSLSTGTTRQYRTVVSVSGATLTLNRALVGTPAASTLATYAERSYYSRLRYTDRNGYVTYSAVTGSEDLRVRLHGQPSTTAHAVHLHLVYPPLLGPRDYASLDLQVFCTKVGGEIYYHHSTRRISLEETAGYVDVVDTLSDDTLAAAGLDEAATALSGSELPTGLEPPPRARSVTSVGGSLVLGNIRSWPQLDVRLLGGGTTVAASAFAGIQVTLLRDEGTGGSFAATDYSSKQVYEFISSGATSITPTNVSATTTTLTVLSAANPGVGRWVYLFHSAGSLTSRRAVAAGWWKVETSDGASFTAARKGTAFSGDSRDVDRLVVGSATGVIPVWLGTDGSVDTVSEGVSVSAEILATRRLSRAVTAVGRRATNANPWLVAGGGGSFPGGALSLSSPVPGTSPSIQFSSLPAGVSLFADGLSRTPTAEIGFSVLRHPSRVVVSYANYPEIFHRPFAELEESRSAVDVNPDDGGEVVAVVPFLSASATGSASQLEGLVVVAKTNSVYVLNTATRSITRVETGGLGCTAPASVVPTPVGVFMANDSGVYRVTRSLEWEYVGERVEGVWRGGTVDRDSLDVAAGHEYSSGNSYKLSYVEDGGESPSRALVYHHAAEGTGRPGAWTEYDNQPVVGWCNLGPDSFAATTAGRVLAVRRAGDETDYRDEASAISSSVSTRPLSFGDAGIRKVVTGVTTTHRVPSGAAESAGTVAAVSTDFQTEFTELDSFVVRGADTEASGLGDSGSRSLVSVRHSLPRRRCQYLQFRLANSTVDEGLDVSGLTFRVAGLGEAGASHDAASTPTRRGTTSNR